MKVIKVYYKTTFILGENSAPWRIIHHISPSVSTIKFYQAIKFWKRKRNGKRDKEIKEYTPIAQKLHKQMKSHLLSETLHSTSHKEITQATKLLRNDKIT